MKFFSQTTVAESLQNGCNLDQCRMCDIDLLGKTIYTCKMNVARCD